MTSTEDDAVDGPRWDSSEPASSTETPASESDSSHPRSDFGFTWGKTDDTIWLRTDDGSYKRVHPAFLEPLCELARGDRDPDSTEPDVLRAVDLLAEEGYLEAGGSVTRDETPPDIRLWPRLLVFTVLGLTASVLIATRWSAVWTPPGSFTGTILVLPFFIVATALHELGHVVASRPYFRARVRFGRLNGVIPAVITRTTDAWRCPRNVRLWISLAGPFVDIVITLGLAVAFVLYSEYSVLGALILVQIFRLLFVLNPLVEGDGYWLFVDAFGTHNLRTHAFRDLKRGRPTGAAAFAAATVGFTATFVLASGYFLLIVSGVL